MKSFADVLLRVIAIYTCLTLPLLIYTIYQMMIMEKMSRIFSEEFAFIAELTSFFVPMPLGIIYIVTFLVAIFKGYKFEKKDYLYISLPIIHFLVCILGIMWYFSKYTL